MLLASCSYEESKKYKNKLVLVSDKDSKKPEEVLLNIVTDNPDEVLSKGIGSAKCVTSRVKPTFCPKDLWGNVFYEVSLDDFNGIDVVDGVVVLVKLPKGFSDMRKVYNICSLNRSYSDVTAKVRVIGGNLLEIPGVSIGRYDSGKEKMSSVFDGVYDFFSEVNLGDIVVREVMSKVKSVNSSIKKTVVKKPNVKSKKKETLTKFFGNCEGGF